jgi:type II secretion system protein G
MLKRKKGKGFSLIELLIVVAIIGIIAAIAIPNLLSALQKGRQKRTMGDMKSLGTAVETVNTDCAYYPTLGDDDVGGTDCTTPSGLTLILTKGGAWLQNPIICDGWRRPMRYVSPAPGDTGTPVTVADPNCSKAFSEGGTTEGSVTYSIVSGGRDGNPTDCGHAKWVPADNAYAPSGANCGSSATCVGFTDFICDISFAGGQFISFPEGMQKGT